MKEKNTYTGGHMAETVDLVATDSGTYYKDPRGKLYRLSDTVCTIPIAGRRHYVDARTAVALPSVSSIMSVQPKPFLQPWSNKLVAQEAVAQIDFLGRLHPDGAVNYLKETANRSNKVAQDKGSEAHDLFERMILGETELGTYPERVKPHVAHFAEFLDTVQPRFISAEQIAWSETHGYAGSYDLIAEVGISFVERKTKKGTFRDAIADPQSEKRTLMIDYKTGKGVYPSTAQQLTAYAMADKILSPDGAEAPMPDIQMGAVLHVTEAGWDFRPFVLGEGPFNMFTASLDYFLALKEWDQIEGSLIGRSMAKSTTRRQTGTERRS